MNQERKQSKRLSIIEKLRFLLLLQNDQIQHQIAELTDEQLFQLVVDILSKSQNSRSEQEKKLLSQIFIKNKFFQQVQTQYGDATFEKLLSRLEIKYVASNSYIFTQGSIGKQFFIIIKGQVSILKQSVQFTNGTKIKLEQQQAGVQGQPTKPQEETIKILNKGECFGEQALLANFSLRTASAFAIKDCIFGVLNKRDYLRIIAPLENKSFIFKEKIEFLQHLSFLKKMNIEQLTPLASYLEVVTVSMNEFLFKQGDKVTEQIYFVAKGQLKMTKEIIQKIKKINTIEQSQTKYIKKIYEIATLTAHEILGVEIFFQITEREYSVQSLSSQCTIYVCHKLDILDKIDHQQYTILMQLVNEKQKFRQDRLQQVLQCEETLNNIKKQENIKKAQRQIFVNNSSEIQSQQQLQQQLQSQQQQLTQSTSFLNQFNTQKDIPINKHKSDSIKDFSISSDDSDLSQRSRQKMRLRKRLTLMHKLKNKQQEKEQMELIKSSVEQQNKEYYSLNSNIIQASQKQQDQKYALTLMKSPNSFFITMSNQSGNNQQQQSISSTKLKLINKIQKIMFNTPFSKMRTKTVDGDRKQIIFSSNSNQQINKQSQELISDSESKNECMSKYYLDNQQAYSHTIINDQSNKSKEKANELTDRSNQTQLLGDQERLIINRESPSYSYKNMEIKQLSINNIPSQKTQIKQAQIKKEKKILKAFNYYSSQSKIHRKNHLEANSLYVQKEECLERQADECLKEGTVESTRNTFKILDKFKNCDVKEYTDNQMRKEIFLRQLKEKRQFEQQKGQKKIMGKQIKINSCRNNNQATNVIGANQTESLLNNKHIICSSSRNIKISLRDVDQQTQEIQSINDIKDCILPNSYKLESYNFTGYKKRKNAFLYPMLKTDVDVIEDDIPCVQQQQNQCFTFNDEILIDQPSENQYIQSTPKTRSIYKLPGSVQGKRQVSLKDKKSSPKLHIYCSPSNKKLMHSSILNSTNQCSKESGNQNQMQSQQFNNITPSSRQVGKSNSKENASIHSCSNRQESNNQMQYIFSKKDNKIFIKKSFYFN